MKILCPTLALLLFAQLPLAQVPAQWSPRGPGGGGAVYICSISPFDANEMYLSCDMSEIFHTTDFGQSWTALPFTQIQGGINGTVQFTNNPAIRFALGRTPGTILFNPLKSSDGGLTWTTVANNPCINGAWQMAVNPQDSSAFAVSDRNHIYYYRNGAVTTIVTDMAAKGAHLAGAFFDGSTIYVCSNKGIFVSVNGGFSFPTFISNGAAGIPAAQEIVSFRGAKQGAQRKFFTVTIAATALTFRTYAKDVSAFTGIYAMSGGLSSWTNLTAGFDPPGGNVLRGYNLAMAPNDTSTLYVGGSAQTGGTILGTVFKTSNSGQSWSNVFLDGAAGAANTVANNVDIFTGWIGSCTNPAYQHLWTTINTTEGIAVDPNNVSRIVRSDKSNVYVSADGAATWHQAFVQPADEHPAGAKFSDTSSYRTSGLETTALNWMLWVDSLRVIVGCNDLTAMYSPDGGQRWSFDYDNANLYYPPGHINDVAMLLKHPQTAAIYAATGEIVGSNGRFDDYRLGQSGGRIVFSNDLGASWQILHDFGHPVCYMTFDSLNPEVLYACVKDTLGGVAGIYRTSNLSAGMGASWSLLPTPPRTQGRPNAIRLLHDGSLVCSYSARDTTPQNIGVTGTNFKFSPSSGVFLMKNGTNAWVDVTPPGMQYFVNDLAIDPNDPSDSTWIASVGICPSGGTAGLYRSTDRGGNWTNILPGIGVRTAVFHPFLPNTLYICTETQGLLYATDANSDTFVPVLDPNYHFRAPQRVFFNPYKPVEMWLLSFGNGLATGCDYSLLGQQITGDDEACENGQSVYSVPDIPGVSYLWTVVGGVILSGQGSHSVVVQWNGGIPAGSITVTAGP